MGDPITAFAVKHVAKDPVGSYRESVQIQKIADYPKNKLMKYKKTIIKGFLGRFGSKRTKTRKNARSARSGRRSDKKGRKARSASKKHKSGIKKF